jgi:hypothetical protein
MIELLPEGNSIGWMQAPPQWIFSHTVRFVGVVRIVIQDGEGFILIKKGKPIYYYFKHGRIELKGHSALDYFNSHPIIEFNLCKYTPEEFALVMKICNIDDDSPNGLVEPESQKSVILEPTLTRIIRVEEPVPDPVAGQVPEQSGEPVAEQVMEPSEEPAAERVLSPLPVDNIVRRPLFPSKMIPAEEPATVPPPVVLDESDIKLIGQIKKLNGIVAISVFNDQQNILLMGDVDIEPLLKIARSMLVTTRKISPLVEWGSFVHMTLQIPEGNVIIAPYRDFYLCLLTTRTINIGHIRRILRDLQLTAESGEI